ESLETAHKVDAIILDKTGTITEGKPAVTDMVIVNEAKAEEVTAILFSMERQSEHPLADAVVKYLSEKNIAPVALQNFTSITGKGVTADYNGKKYLLGNTKLLVDYKVVIPGQQEKQIQTLQQAAKTVVLLATGSELLAIIAIADKVKSTSREAITRLQQEGIDVYMLTGDNHHTARAIAHEVGLKHFKANVLPAEKAEFVKQLQAEGKKVAMVGDGINDSHALAQADISIAMGKGSDIAMDVAKMTLITSDLNSIPKALQLSRMTVQAVRQNLFWAFIYNLIGIPIA